MTPPLALIIEDDAQIAEINSLALQEAGFTVEKVYDGNTALSRLDQITPKLILLDLHLPGVNGTQILSKINGDERLSSCKVISTTADPFLAYQHQSEVNMVLIKPVSFTHLRELATRFRTN